MVHMKVTNTLNVMSKTEIMHFKYNSKMTLCTSIIKQNQVTLILSGLDNAKHHK